MSRDLALHEAASLSEAAGLLEQFASDGCLLAGGTNVLVDVRNGRVRPGHLVSIARVPDLRGVTEDQGALRIGALTTLAELHRSPLVEGSWAALRDATSRMAAPEVRNLATVGGNVAAAVPCADLPPLFSVLRAEVVLWSPEGERRLRIDEFIVGARETVRKANEILTQVIVPAQPSGFGAAYERFALREGNAIAVAGVAASLQRSGDRVVDARAALAAVAPVPKAVPLTGVLTSLDEGSLEAAARATMAAAEPISDVRGSADFRRRLVGVLAKRALQTAAARAAGEEGPR